MKLYRYLLITCLLSVCLVSVGQEVKLIPFESNGLWGFMNETKDKIVILPEFDEIKKYEGQDGWFQVTKGGLRGLMDPMGKIIIKPEFDEITKYEGQDGWFQVNKGGKWRLIDPGRW